MPPVDTTRKRAFPIVPVAIGTIVVALAVIFVFRPARGPQENASASLAEAKTYVRNLELSDVSMHASESFMKQQLVEIEGKIANHGNRPLKSVDVFCLFYNPSNQEIHRERSAIVAAKSTPLGPGQSRTFRLPFDALPDGWNQAVPRMVIAGITFAD